MPSRHEQAKLVRPHTMLQHLWTRPKMAALLLPVEIEKSGSEVGRLTRQKMLKENNVITHYILASVVNKTISFTSRKTIQNTVHKATTNKPHKLNTETTLLNSGPLLGSAVRPCSTHFNWLLPSWRRHCARRNPIGYTRCFSMSLARGGFCFAIGRSCSLR
jgi:hypothetical protein